VKWENGFMKDNISRYKGSMRLQIKQFIAFNAERVSKKDTHSATGVKKIFFVDVRKWRQNKGT
jgi:hypothetical protein